MCKSYKNRRDVVEHKRWILWTKAWYIIANSHHIFWGVCRDASLYQLPINIPLVFCTMRKTHTGDCYYFFFLWAAGRCFVHSIHQNSRIFGNVGKKCIQHVKFFNVCGHVIFCAYPHSSTLRSVYAKKNKLRIYRLKTIILSITIQKDVGFYC